MADAPSNSDAYSQAKTNIRDTVKWLANTFAALAAVVIAGSSFSGIGKLTSGSTAFYTSIAAVMLAFSCICTALYITLQLLRSDALYPSDLDPRISASSADEVQPIRDEIDKHSVDLFPPEFPSMKLLLERIEKLQEDARNTDSDEEYNEAVEGIGLLARHQQRVLDFANYLRLYNRVMKATPRLFFLGVVALVSLLMFANFVQQDERDLGPKSALVFIEQQKQSATIKEEFEKIDPVLFVSGEAKISNEGLQRVNNARDALLRHPELGILLLAHTDTVAPIALNSALASKRAAAVRDSLVQGGGIAASRVFVTILPKGTLPLVTNEQVEEQKNRSVQLRLFKMPN